MASAVATQGARATRRIDVRVVCASPVASSATLAVLETFVPRDLSARLARVLAAVVGESCVAGVVCALLGCGVVRGLFRIVATSYSSME